MRENIKKEHKIGSMHNGRKITPRGGEKDKKTAEKKEGIKGGEEGEGKGMKGGTGEQNEK